MTKQELDKRIHDTYYSYKNLEMLPSVIILSVVFFIFKGWLVLEILLWLGYGVMCAINNEKLRNCPTVKKEREFLIANYDRLLNLK